MNWDRIEGNWKEFKGKVQQQIVRLKKWVETIRIDCFLY